MNVEQALEEFGIRNFTKRTEYYEIKCPFHDDDNPSGQIHHKTGFFHCWVCKKRTSLEGFLQKYSNFSIYQVKRRLGVKSDVKNPISPNEIEVYHQAIWNHPVFLEELHRRCITDDLIRYYRIGVRDDHYEKRITIPILNEVGEYANIFYYIPGATERKFVQSGGRDRSRRRFYPIEQLEYDQILICGGLLKAVAAAAVLNQYGIGALSPTCSENEWPNELTDRLKDKLLYVNCDVDEAGARSEELRCRVVKAVGREVHKVSLKLEQVGGLEKGDINDFLHFGGDLYKLLLDSPEWHLIPGAETEEVPARGTSFREAFACENVGQRVMFTGIVSEYNTSPYTIPEVVEVNCLRNEEFCQFCDVNSQVFNGKDTEMKIGKEHPVILALIGENTEEHHRHYKNAFKIPKRCRQCTFKTTQKSYNVTEVRLDEQTDPTSRIAPLTMRIGYLVNGPQDFESQAYELTGRLFPSPKNQIASFLISECKPTADALDSYQSPNDEYFRIFRPNEWTIEGIQEKLDDIYYDFECNVTRIYQRRDLHLVYDLAYHSVLHFDFGESKEENGWVEALVIGDTGQGKSKIINTIQKHYGLGFKIDAKRVSEAGLTIGVEKSHSKHFAIYGAFPKNDKKLIIFEELKGMDPKTLQSLTETRSSGLVQTTKIAQKIRKARVRLICNSNPPDRREVDSYAFGIESAISVIGTHEDLRRFDIVYIAGKKDINGNDLNASQANPPKTEHKYTDDLCQKLVLKAWKCEQIQFEDLKYIMEVTKKLLTVYSHGPPVLDTNSSHLKVAKLSAALAARTCSYENNVLLVRKCHVDYIYYFLDKIYSSPSCRLREKSKSIRDSSELRNTEELTKYLHNMTNCADIMMKIKEVDEIDNSFIKDLVGDFSLGNSLFGILIRSNAISRIKGNKYAKTAEFVKLLNKEQFEIEKPEYLKKMEGGF